MIDEICDQKKKIVIVQICKKKNLFWGIIFVFVLLIKKNGGKKLEIFSIH